MQYIPPSFLLRARTICDCFHVLTKDTCLLLICLNTILEVFQKRGHFTYFNVPSLVISQSPD